MIASKILSCKINLGMLRIQKFAMPAKDKLLHLIEAKANVRDIFMELKVEYCL